MNNICFIFFILPVRYYFDMQKRVFHNIINPVTKVGHILFPWHLFLFLLPRCNLLYIIEWFLGTSVPEFGVFFMLGVSFLAQSSVKNSASVLSRKPGTVRLTRVVQKHWSRLVSVSLRAFCSCSARSRAWWHSGTAGGADADMPCGSAELGDVHFTGMLQSPESARPRYTRSKWERAYRRGRADGEVRRWRAFTHGPQLETVPSLAGLGCSVFNPSHSLVFFFKDNVESWCQIFERQNLIRFIHRSAPT